MSTNALGYITRKPDAGVVNFPALSTATLAALSTITVAADDVTASTNQLLSGKIQLGGAPAAGHNVVTPTASAIIHAIPNCAIGNGFDLLVANATGQVMTLVGGVGVTIVGTAAVPTATVALVRFIVTGAGAISAFVVLSA